MNFLNRVTHSKDVFSPQDVFQPQITSLLQNEALNVGCALPGNPGNPPWNRRTRGLFGLTHRHTGNRLTNHGQQVRLDLSPGWCAVFVTEPGSLCPSFAAKMLRCQSLQQRESLFTRQPSEEAEEQISSPLPWRQRVFMGERSGASELWEGSGGEMIRKRCGNRGSEQA